MEQGCTVLTDGVRAVQLLKIGGFSATAAFESSEYIKSKWNLDGHEWEVQFYPNYGYTNKNGAPVRSWVVIKLILVTSQPQSNKFKVNLSCRLVDPSQRRNPYAEKSVCHVFPSPPCCTLAFMSRDDIRSSGYVVNDLLTVECAITVLKELTDIVVPAHPPVPPSDLHNHLGELWQGRTGADVTFVLESGESFHAHKAILAARSPVFMAEFFGGMNERTSGSVRIQGMEADVFKAMLQFIYTDTAPELDGEPELAVTMAQHLLAAADRYGLDKLKLICGSKLAGGISIDTVGTTLALAEQHSCSLLKDKCVDFIARSPETLDAVLATEGYNHLVASWPLVLTELLRAAHGKRRRI